MIAELALELPRDTSAPSVARRAIAARFAGLAPAAMADLMRVHSTGLANATSFLKEHANSEQKLQQNVSEIH